jgi:HAD superfamily hydrolase (TIGR01549 family)
MPRPPHALLLDFGGVIAEPEWTSAVPADLIDEVSDLVRGAVSRERVEADLIEGNLAYAQWRDVVSRAYAPPELTHAQIWDNFIVADWPSHARLTVIDHATDLTYRWVDRSQGWRLRPGVQDLLDLTKRAELPVAVVSNIACGAPLRAFLDRAGVSDRFAAQIYSDEVGARKPNPAMIKAATDQLGVPPSDCWFVGDKLYRDVLCCRRAGIGTAVLVPPPGRGDPHHPWLAPDVVAWSMVEVHQLLAEALG